MHTTLLPILIYPVFSLTNWASENMMKFSDPFPRNSTSLFQTPEPRQGPTPGSGEGNKISRGEASPTITVQARGGARTGPQ